MKPRIDSLIRYPVFADFSPSEMASVARILELVELSPGEILFEFGSTGTSMFFLDVGRIQIDHPTTPGKFKVLASINPPGIFGEMSLLNAEPRSARAVAIRPSVLWKMDRSSLLTLAEEKHAAAFKIMVWIASELSNRLRDTNEKLIEIYAKPFQSIQELKRQLEELTPGFISKGFSLEEDSAAD